MLPTKEQFIEWLRTQNPGRVFETLPESCAYGSCARELSRINVYVYNTETNYVEDKQLITVRHDPWLRVFVSFHDRLDNPTVSRCLSILERFV